MIFVVPFLQPSQADLLFLTDHAIAELNDVYTYNKLGNISDSSYAQYLSWFIEDYTKSLTLDKELVYLQVDQVIALNAKSKIKTLRLTETEQINVGYVSAMFSVETIRISDAWKSVGLTTFLIFMLTILAVVFNNDTNEYVIVPINKMVASVKQLTENPMLTANNDDDNIGEFETAMLQGTIARIGKLLQLGFGHAGSEIIKASLSSSLAANTGGKHMNAIFGFCDIRNFTDATECLQREIMNFVNEIADVVHCIIVDHGGAPNKNVGDAFLLVWSLPDDCILSGDDNNATFAADNSAEIVAKVQQLADSALISLIKICILINEKNKTSFMKYRTNENIIRRMGVDWEVKLGWGLHCGWAIEGAIGSRFKIDASYLSPNVNLSEDLEGATKFYGSPFLVSESMVAILSPFARSVCRQVDRVHIAGIERPFNLYCVDIWQCDRDKLKKMGRDTEPPFVGAFRFHKTRSYTKSEKKFFSDNELRTIHERIPSKHKVLWAQGLREYLNGDWMKAAMIMQEVLEVLPTDGACTAILGYMRERKLKCPKDWPGYREHE